jgi:hypothetical protein
MATRLKVTRTMFLNAIDAAIALEEEFLAEVKAEAEAYDWRENERPWVEALTKALDNPKTDEKSFGDLAYRRRSRPDFERKLNRGYIEDLKDLRATVEMAEETFTVSTDDRQIQQVIRASRRQAKPS